MSHREFREMIIFLKAVSDASNQVAAYRRACGGRSSNSIPVYTEGVHEALIHCKVDQYGNGFDASLRTRFAVTLAISAPTSGLIYITRRAHMLNYRQTSNGYTEVTTWRCHVSWRSPVNYLSSAVLVVISVITQAVSGLVIAVTFYYDDSNGQLYDPAERHVVMDVLLVRCNWAMMCHASGLLLLSLWGYTCTRGLRGTGDTLSDQFRTAVVQRPSTATPSLSFAYPPRRTHKVLRQKMTRLFGCSLLGSLAAGPLVAGLFYQRRYRHFPTWNQYQNSVDAGTADIPYVAPIQFDLQSLYLTQSEVSSVRLSLQDDPIVTLTFCLGIVAAITLLADTFNQLIEVTVMRCFWQRLWSRRASGEVNGETDVEGWRAVLSRPPLIWVWVLASLDSWVLSNAIVIGSQHPWGYRDPAFEYAIAIWPIPGWCLVFAISIVVHHCICAVVVLTSRRKGDCWPTFGRKEEWLRSGVVNSVAGDRFGALVLPKQGLPGVLGFGANPHSPVEGQYTWTSWEAPPSALCAVVS